MVTRKEFREKHKNDPDTIKLAESIWEEVDSGKKIGFDVAQHWKDMLASLPKNNLDDKTLKLVQEKLTGMRKGGEELAYKHSVRVSESLKAHGYSREVIIAGLLHDIVEDSNMTLKELAEAGYSDRIVLLVDLCTHNAVTQNKDARWTQMIARLIAANDEDAWAIKLADLLDNCRSCRALPADRQLFLRTVKAPLLLSITKDIFGRSGIWQELTQEINNK